MKKKTERVVYADGRVAYVQEGQAFHVFGPDGGQIPIVDRQKVPKVNLNPELEKAEYRGHSWIVTEKNPEQLAQEGIISNEEAERRLRANAKKGRG